MQMLNETSFATMQVYLLLVFGCLSVNAAGVLDEVTNRINGINGWFIPFPDGSLRWVTSEALGSLDKISDIYDKRNSMDFFVYTKKNQLLGKKISSNPTPEEIKESGLNFTRPFVICTHGFFQNFLSSNINIDLRQAIFKNKEVNFIFLSWLPADTWNYISASKWVPLVAEKLAELIENLVKNYNLDCQNTHMIGHSLGAHVVGLAAKKATICRIRQITGLDPALPLFAYNQTESRLSNTDADYVETIQTDGGAFGHVEPVGTASFYCNGGKKQPGCLENICHHERSVSYAIEAYANNNFPSTKCTDYKAATGKKCGNQFSDVRMGDDNNRFVARGVYYVQTHRRSPFGMLKV